MSKTLPSISSWAYQYVDDEHDDEEVIDVSAAPVRTTPPVAVSVGLIAQFAFGAVVAMIASVLPPILAIPGRCSRSSSFAAPGSATATYND